MKLATKSFSILVPLALAGTALADAPPAKIDVAVTKQGFNPDSITVPAHKPVTLIFTRKTDETCTKKVVITLDDGKKLERDLPLDKPVEIAVTFPKAGTLSYACSMDMTRGTIIVR